MSLCCALGRLQVLGHSGVSEKVSNERELNWTYKELGLLGLERGRQNGCKPLLFCKGCALDDRDKLFSSCNGLKIKQFNFQGQCCGLDFKRRLFVRLYRHQIRHVKGDLAAVELPQVVTVKEAGEGSLWMSFSCPRAAAMVSSLLPVQCPFAVISQGWHMCQWRLVWLGSFKASIFHFSWICDCTSCSWCGF